PRRPHDRLRGRAGDRAQDLRHLRHVDWRVFGVDDEKIEAGASKSLRRGGRAAREPGPDLCLAGSDRTLELIDGQVHGFLSAGMMKARPTRAIPPPPGWNRGGATREEAR